MALSKREQKLASIRIAAANGDEQTALRIYIENHGIGFGAFKEQVNMGRVMRSKTEHKATNATTPIMPICNGKEF